jgi:tetratricopeptide (TPR) repeat protein
LIRSRHLPLLFLGSTLFLGTARAADTPAATQPAQTSPESIEEPAPVVVDADMAADIPYWEARIVESPGDVTIRLALGNAYAMGQRLPEAVREFRTLLRDYPEYKSAWNNLGSAYRALGRRSRALDAYQRAVKIDPRYALAYYNIGVVYDSAGHYERAIDYYGLALKYDPSLADPRKNPQVVTNRRVFAVLLHNYVESAGTLALPLEPAYPPPEE